MKKYFFTTLLLLLSFPCLWAQHIAFQKLYSTTGPSNQGSGIVAQANGDIIICGIRSVPTGPQYIANIYLFRINSLGDTLWTKEIGASPTRELAYNMVQLPNGNLVIAGSINTPPAGLPDALIVCTDISGNVLWQKQYGGLQSDYATSAAFDGQHIIVAGVTESFGAGYIDAWLLKLDQAGDTLWTKTFGGVAEDNAWDVAVVHNEYYLTGGTYSFANGQYNDAWVIKTDANGNKIWQKTYGVQDKVDWAWNISPVTANGVADGLVFTGIKDTEPNAPASSYGTLFFVKIDTAGNVVWDKSISSTGSTNWRREGFDVQQLPDEGFVICGYKLEPAVQSQQIYVVRADKTGNVIWDTAYGTSDSNYYANALAVTSNGGWVITGSVFNIPQQVRYIYATRFNPYNTNIETAPGNNDIVIYPNPVQNGILHVKIPSGIAVAKVQLKSINGQLLHEYKPQSANGIFTLPIHTEGVHIIEIYTPAGIIRSKVTNIK